MDYKLTADDKEEVEAFNKEHKQRIVLLEQLKKFKVGDYLIAHEAYHNWDESADEATITFKVQVNDLGEPNKFQVVHITDYGVPFIKLVNINGKMPGCMWSAWDIDECLFDGNKYYFELDPSYVDSILLGQPYDPYAVYREKLKVQNEIRKYNKSIKINNKNLDILVNFFVSVNIGDIFWTSSTRYLQVEAKEYVKVRDINNYKIKIKSKSNIYEKETEVKSTKVTVLTVKPSNGKSFKIVPDYFATRAIYTSRPRDSKELNIMGELKI